MAKKKKNSYGIKTRLNKHVASDQLSTAYRPMRFSELYGPAKDISSVLINSLIKHDRKLAQKAWLVSGPPSSGKTSLAMLMSLAANCVDPQVHPETGEKIEPCLKCPSCLGIAKRGLLSKHTAFLYYNVAAMRKENVVEVINTDMATGSSLEGRHKFVVFEEAHNLTKQQKEALLKPVENTLSRVYLIFLTTEPGKLIENKAMRGRLTPLNIGHWKDKDLVKMLMDITQQEFDAGRAPFIDPEGIERIVVVSDSDARIAVSNLQLVLDGVKPKFGNVIQPKEVIPVLGQPVEYNEDFKTLFYSILNCNYQQAVITLDKKFDRVTGVEARPVAIAVIKYLRRVGYSTINKGKLEEGKRVLRQLHAFNHSFWQQIADDFTALTIATFAALEAGRKSK